MSHGWRVTLSLAFLMVLLASPSAVAAPTISEYPLPVSGQGPTGIAAGPDGNVWFAEYEGRGAIGRVTPSGDITEFTSGISGVSFGIALGSEGDLWFTEPNTGAIGRITPAGAASEFSISPYKSSVRQPVDIATGPNGDLWFTIFSNPAAIGRITPSGTITIFNSGLAAASEPIGIAAGPEGDMWFTEAGKPGAIGRIAPEGTITQFSTGLTADSEPRSITSGPEGDLWFTEASNPGAIGRITPEGTITQYTTGLLTDLRPEAIAAADNGNIYFTEFNDPGEIGELQPGGTMTQVATPTSNGEPEGIASGPNGNIWFTEFASNKVGTLTIAPAADGATASDVTAGGATLAASIVPNSQTTEYLFQYGPSQYESRTEAASASAGASAVPVSATLSGLAPATVYHFRVVAKNASGTSYGPEGSFTTAPVPSALTEPAESVQAQSATLRGTVDPKGAASTYRFEWGTSTSYGNSAPTTEGQVGSESSEYPIAQSVTGLLPGTVYHFRIVASDCGGCAAGTAYGQDVTFTTPSTPLSEPAFPPASGPPAPTPSPSPSPAPQTVAPPAIGRTAVLGAVSGSVLVELPGSEELVPIATLGDIPIGSKIDAQHGVVRVTTALNESGRLQSADVWDGTFTLGQRPGAGMTTFTLPAPRACTAAHSSGMGSTLARAASDGGSKAATLWAKDDHGEYSTRGKNSVATVRGTDWETVNRCDGTLTFVKHGVVSVRDSHTGRTVTLRAGQHFLASR